MTTLVAPAPAGKGLAGVGVAGKAILGVTGSAGATSVTATDSLVLSDSATAHKHTAAAATDSLILSDTAHATTHKYPAASDSLSLSDSATATGPGITITPPAPIAEAVPGTPTITVGGGSVSASATDAIVITDSTAGYLTVVSVYDGLVLGDSATASSTGGGHFTRTAADSLVLSDSARASGQPVHAADSLVLGDAAHATEQDLAGGTDSLHLGDTAAAVGPNARSASGTDSLSLSDSAHVTAQFVHGFDAVMFADAVDVKAQPGRASDALVVADSAAAHGFRLASASDSVVLGDSAAIVGSLFALAVDGVVVADVTRARSQPAHGTDSISIFDVAVELVSIPGLRARATMTNRPVFTVSMSNRLVASVDL